MKVYQDLTIRGDAERITAFLVGLPDAASGWTRSEEKSGRVPGYVAIDTPDRADLPPSTVFVATSSDSRECSVVNIIPSAASHMDAAEYNRVLLAFLAECVRGQAEDLALEIATTPGEISIGDQFSAGTIELLRHFSVAANKSNAAAHPKDRERWLRFVAATIRNGERGDPRLVEDWLVSDGWSAELARRLASEYAFAEELQQYVNGSGSVVSAA